VKYFIDSEFYEDGTTIDLISLGVVAEDGRELYCCSTEARLDLVPEWHRKNVLPSLPPYGDDAWVTRQEMADRLVLFTGHEVPIRSPLLDGFRGSRLPHAIDDTDAHFVAYYGDYDWVCLCQLFGTMMGLPKHFKRWCYDLKQLVDDRNAVIPVKPESAHNALVDARWNRDLWMKLMGGASLPVRLTRPTFAEEPEHLETQILETPAADP
jgi:hypothetical protein